MSFLKNYNKEIVYCSALNLPQSILEFQQWFGDEESCIKYLKESRWPDAFICPVFCDKRSLLYNQQDEILSVKPTAVELILQRLQ